jgi:acyl-CoA ligase (AMP-forming) (exosortase A-associated)
MRCNLGDLVREAASQHADRHALTFKNQAVSYRELWTTTLSVAAGLEGSGVRGGERLAIYLDKRPETVVAMLAASRVGAVFVPVNPILKGPQVGHLLRDCDVSTLVTTPPRLAVLRDELESCPALRTVVLVTEQVPEETHGLQVVRWTDLDAGGEPAGRGGIDVDLAAILYTSGSTGKPKGVVLSHRNLIVGAESVSSYLQNRADDVILSVLPLSFDAGLSQITTAFSVGAHVVLHNHLVPGDVVKLCARHAVTGLTCVPPLWIQIAELDWPDAAARSLRYFANTGGRMPKPTLDRLREVFPQASPFLMYGLTEAFRSTYLDPAEVDRRPDSIGKAIPNAEILVLRPDGTPCGRGEEGELVHRGALVAQGYWNDPLRTAERFKPLPGQPGWRAPELAVFSGDTVVSDEEGFLYFVGRKDDMIKTSGYRVSPTEIEEVAYASGLVRDAVALGAPDDRLGERVVLVVAPADRASFDVDALIGFLRKGLPLFMVPSTVHELDQLPRSANGKFDRNQLKADLAS